MNNRQDCVNQPRETQSRIPRIAIQMGHGRGESFTKNMFPGMFPYVCLATMPLFCRVDWPRRLGHYFNWRWRFSAADVKSIDEDRAKAIDGQTKNSPKVSKRSASSSSEILNDEHEGERQFLLISQSNLDFKEFLAGMFTSIRRKRTSGL